MSERGKCESRELAARGLQIKERRHSRYEGLLKIAKEFVKSPLFKNEVSIVENRLKNANDYYWEQLPGIKAKYSVSDGDLIDRHKVGALTTLALV